MSGDTQYTENELLISRFLSNQASETEKKQVMDMLQTNSEFKELYISTQQRLKAVDALIFYDSIDEEKALTQIFAKANIEEKATTKLKQIKPIYTFLKIASVILLGLVISYLVMNRPQPILFSSTEKTLPNKLMPDSSVIALNINSTLQYSNKFGIKNRKLKLSGEAFFSVKKNKQLPFIIDCNGLFVEVTGTSFTISNYIESNLIKVYVSTGQVKVYNNENQQQLLNAGEMAIYNKTEKTLNKLSIGLNSNINSWYTQTLTFDDCPLQQVINDINNYYKVDIILNVTNIQNCRLSASFEKASLESVLEMICLSFGLELTNNETLTLKGDGC